MSILNELLKIHGKHYEWNDKMKELTGRTGFEFGVIAQEVQEVFPDIVTHEDDGYLAVDYNQFVPILIEAIRELKTEIDSLKSQKEV